MHRDAYAVYIVLETEIPSLQNKTLFLIYVDHISFLMDLKILIWTVRIVLRREGINEPGNATNSEFRGVLGEKK